LVRHDFDYIGDLYNIETIAKGKGVKIRKYLNQKYGRGRSCKLKGRAIIQYYNGRVAEAEIHWFEANGIGHVEAKSIRYIER